ncbi:MAG: hypothetical protein V3U57_09935 [Robiginitomaculum sp.]
MYKQERKFVTTAHAQIQVLESIWHGEISANYARDTQKALQAIRDVALQVQALAVFRAAVLCQDICLRLGQNAGGRLRQNLIGLKALIGQYAGGLYEIDPSFEMQMKNRQQSVKQTEAEEIFLADIRAGHLQATQALKPLLQLVKKENCISALQTLMDVHEWPQKALLPDTENRQDFDVVMRPITNLVLSAARQNGKNVSISYGANFDDLEENLATRVRRFVQLVCLNIVARSIGDSAAQINLTAQMGDKNIRFNISWHGQVIRFVQQNGNSHFEKAITALEARGGAFILRQGKISQGMDATIQFADISFPKNIKETTIKLSEKNNIGAGRMVAGGERG